MSIQYSIENSGDSVMKTGDIMSLLGLNQFDLEDPVRFERFKDVISGLKNEKEYAYLIKKTTMNKNVDKLDHLWGYLQLKKEREQIASDYKKVDESVGTLLTFASENGNNPIELNDYKDLSSKRAEIVSKLQNLEKEISLYE